MEHSDPEMHEDFLNKVMESNQGFLDLVLAVHNVNVHRVVLRFVCCGNVRIGGKLSNHTLTDTFECSNCGNSKIVLYF